MMFDNTEWDNMDALINKMQNAPDNIFLIGEGMAQRHGNDCAEAQALYYVSDSLKKDLKRLQSFLYAGARKGEDMKKTLQEA